MLQKTYPGLSAKDKLDKMVNSHLGATKQSWLATAQNETCVKRVDNRDFMSDFNQIFYNKEDPKSQTGALPKRQPEFQERVQPHGMNLINFTLTEHLIDDKINNATKEALAKTESRM